ncbi:MAG: hypothetical protein KJ593_07065 [Candidatus Omnitrophica bacterium]|nr:hypothetical protein [Candidatus Omnitrophota bacterium]
MKKNKLFEKINNFFKDKTEALDKKLEKKAKETPCCSSKDNAKGNSCCS